MIKIIEVQGDWYAIDTKVNKVIASAENKALLLKALNTK